jgi:hypothetical protein
MWGIKFQAMTKDIHKKFPLYPAHEGKNKGKYISFHYERTLGALISFITLSFLWISYGVN